MSSLHEVVQKALEKFPLYSQEKSKDPLVSIKLFNAFGAGAWYLTEYDPKKRIAFGYVVNRDLGEWGYVSINEMAECLFRGMVPMIEIDVHFTSTVFSQLHL